MASLEVRELLGLRAVRGTVHRRAASVDSAGAAGREARAEREARSVASSATGGLEASEAEGGTAVREAPVEAPAPVAREEASAAAGLAG
jgi:hypothetical protein